MSNPEEVHENLKALDLVAPPELMHAIDEITAPVHSVTWPSGRPENSDI
jgi:aryl-alcohol dehydrogenase-like predicted oxidoreductase